MTIVFLLLLGVFALALTGILLTMLVSFVAKRVSNAGRATVKKLKEMSEIERREREYRRIMSQYAE